jgi:hypothetical protein
MRFLYLLIGLLAVLPTSEVAAETFRVAFVFEYVRELGLNERMRELGEKDLAEAGEDKSAAMIRSGTRIILELNSQIEMLKRFTLNPPFDGVQGAIAVAYQRKIDVYQRTVDIGTVFQSGPKPGVDYGAMAAEMPKLTATLEYIDRTLFQATPLVFRMLIDDKPDDHGHMSRLRITKAERSRLVQTLQIDFGDKMNRADQNFIVSSATVLRDYLSKKKGYKCSDE